ncbi:hypothetical protein PSSHI_07440 [Photobacterium sp. R1]
MVAEPQNRELNLVKIQLSDPVSKAGSLSSRYKFCHRFVQQKTRSAKDAQPQTHRSDKYATDINITSNINDSVHQASGT